MHRLTAPVIALTAGIAVLAGEPNPVTGTAATAGTVAVDTAGRRLYEDACANCHGIDGAGVSSVRLGLEVPLPDFTDCNFASREPDADWVAVAHRGGPTRGFSDAMPAFGDALTVDQIQRIMDYVRTFCGDAGWPRGELNLPRPFVTEKAYPEDEAVLTADAAAEGPGELRGELVYEKRFGARNQLELVVPFAVRDRSDAGRDWSAGLGDVAVGVKRDLYHSFEAGSIFSLAGEFILPTGDEGNGFGSGTVVFEPFAAFGQILPAGAFLHGQAGVELPFDPDRAEKEAFWRAVLGKTWASGPRGFGRAWSPMVEVLAARELESGASTAWDLLPQVQVTLNTRQHVMANLGVRIPVTDADVRETRILVYILWDWFDGGFFEGW